MLSSIHYHNLQLCLKIWAPLCCSNIISYNSWCIQGSIMTIFTEVLGFCQVTFLTRILNVSQFAVINKKSLAWVCIGLGTL